MKPIVCRAAVSTFLSVAGIGLLVPSCHTVQAIQVAEPSDGQSVEQRGLEQMVREVDESLAAKNWLEAAEKFDTAWQAAVRGDDPLMLKFGTETRQLAPGETSSVAGGVATLESLYSRAPEEFRSSYSQQFADVAEQSIQRAIQSTDIRALSDLTARYYFCASSETAMRVLAKHHLDRGDSLDAALVLGRLQRRLTQPDVRVTLQMATCYQKAGLQKDAEELLASAPQGALENYVGPDAALLKPGTPEAIQSWLKKQAGADLAESDDWRQPGGSYRRLAQQPAVPAGLVEQWTSDSFHVHDVLYADTYNPRISGARQPLERTLEHLSLRNNVIVPTCSPLVVDDLVILRTPFGVRAIRIETGELVWEVTRPDTGLRSLLENAQALDSARRRARGLEFQLAEISLELVYHVLRTNTSAQMSVSGNTLFIVDECSPARWGDRTAMFLQGQSPGTSPSNYIRAYDVRSGLFLWEIGGQTQSASRTAGKGNLLAGYYFLGAPLVLGQQTYVLAESGEAISLIQIRPPGENSQGNPSITRSQVLTIPQFKLPSHPVRQHAGLIPSFAQGLLICPTCDERIVAVSAQDNTIRWVFRYGGNTRTQDLGGSDQVLIGGFDLFDSERVDVASRWTDSLARIASGKIIVTPRDSDQLYCLDLQQGTELWTLPRSAFHSVAAVTDEMVVLAGNQRIAAFRLDNGTELWSCEIRNGVVSGTCVSTGRLLHVPTSSGEIVVLDLTSGQHLFSQPAEGSSVAFNLLAVKEGLLKQSPTSASWLKPKSEPAPADLAAELLMKGNAAEAKTKLLSTLEATPQDRESRELLIQVLLAELRSDFDGHRGQVTQVRQLIENSVQEADVAPLLHSLLNMNLTDVPVIARQIQNRTERYQSELSELVAASMQNSTDVAVEQLADDIAALILDLPSAQEKVVSAGFLRRRKSCLTVSGIRRAILNRPNGEQQVLQQQLTEVIGQVAQSLPADETRLQFVSHLASAGLGAAALSILNEDVDPFWNHRAKLLAESICLTESMQPARPEPYDQLLAIWKSRGDLGTVRAWQHDLSQPISDLTRLRFQIRSEDVRTERLKAAQTLADELAPQAPAVWNGEPVVTPSDHKTMTDVTARKLPANLPDRAIPLYGAPGYFRGWSFSMTSALTPPVQLVAHDPEGRIRWTAELPLLDLMNRYGNHNSQDRMYVTTWGPLLAFKIHSAVIVIDGTSADADRSPRILWRDDLSRISSEENVFRDFVPGADRLPQYFPQLSGFYPVGQLTPYGLPVIAGQRLLMLEPLTGSSLWDVDGIPRDVVLLCDEESVLLLSETSRQIEVRSLIDGSVTGVSRLPDWWGDAVGNVGSSVRDIELEEGVDSLWRLLLHDHSCVLFRLTAGKSVVECRNLLTDEVAWQTELPQETVFSNVVDDTLAVLSDGEQLKLIDADTGRILFDQKVSKVPAPRELVLRQSLGMWIVLPEGVDDPSLELAPVQNAQHVFGRMFGIQKSSMQLQWDLPLEHRHVRNMVPERAPILPNVPILVLLNRSEQKVDNRPVPRVRYSVQVVDVRNGRDLYNDPDVGITLNDHWLHIDAAAKTLTLSFETRTVTFRYDP